MPCVVYGQTDEGFWWFCASINNILYFFDIIFVLLNSKQNSNTGDANTCTHKYTLFNTFDDGNDNNFLGDSDDLVVVFDRSSKLSHLSAFWNV